MLAPTVMTEPATALFALHGPRSSLVIERTADGLVWRHWGARVRVDGLPPLAAGRGAASFALDRDQPRPVIAGAGSGWFGPAVARVRRDGALLATRFDDSEVAQTGAALEITARDARAAVTITQRFALDPAGGALIITTRLRNDGTSPLAVDWLASALLPLPAQSAAILSFSGRHNGEFVEHREPMPAHRWVREGRRGLTGHGGPPGAFVLSAGADDHRGEVWAVQLAWSGDAHLAIERDDEGDWSLAAGAALTPGEIVLAPGESHAAPDVLAVFSDAGLNGASQAFHATIRASISWPAGVMAPRPVHLNSWEAQYFDHDEARAMALADRAAALGVERFVLDDGWFKGRDHDRAGLGDWSPDPRKYPRGLAPLAAHVSALGMAFGLWVEPEMVNPDSDLYRAHPDWALGEGTPTARHQLVLDLRRTEVRDYLFNAIDTLLASAPIAYLKWDHNRDLAPPGGHAQVAGAYALIDRIRAAHPQVEIEACAGGGGRIDAGIICRTHRFWTSDNLDAVSRVAIQRGFLRFMPPELMGAHVGASPAHATGRSQSLAFRAAVALPGHFGVELDPARLGVDEAAVLAAWIGRYQSLRDRLHGGQVWLGEGTDGLRWQAHGPRDALLLFALRTDPPRDRRPQSLRLPMLADAGDMRVRLLAETAPPRPGEPALLAELRDAGRVWPGDWLAAVGLPMPPLPAESAALFAIDAV